jgi:hypothetical protein
VFQLFCCGQRAAVVGYEALEEYQFYSASVTDSDVQAGSSR